ncbi:hypothetical protein VTO42DRAFT_2544 [Malbranchea cinnamomea]
MVHVHILYCLLHQSMHGGSHDFPPMMRGRKANCGQTHQLFYFFESSEARSAKEDPFLIVQTMSLSPTSFSLFCLTRISLFSASRTSSKTCLSMSTPPIHLSVPSKHLSQIDCTGGPLTYSSPQSFVPFFDARSLVLFEHPCTSPQQLPATLLRLSSCTGMAVPATISIPAGSLKVWTMYGPSCLGERGGVMMFSCGGGRRRKGFGLELREK